MKQKNTNVGSYIAVLALGYSIIYAGYYLYCYVKSVLFHEPFEIIEFKPVYHWYIWLPVIFFLLYILVWKFIERGNKYEVGMIRERPSEDSPMMINYLMNKKFNKNAFISTIMLLVNEKYLLLDKDTNGYYLTDLNGISEKPYFNSPEEYLIQALFRQFSMNGKLYLKRLSKKNKDFNSLFISYSNFFVNSSKYREFMIQDYFIFVVYTLLFSWIIYMSVTSIFHFNVIYALVVLVVYAIMFGKSINIKWRNRGGKRLYQKWYSYKKFLEKNTSLYDKELQEVVIWNDYLITATALDINTKNSNDVFKDIKLSEYDFVRTISIVHLSSEEEI